MRRRRGERWNEVPVWREGGRRKEGRREERRRKEGERIEGGMGWEGAFKVSNKCRQLWSWSPFRDIGA